MIHCKNCHTELDEHDDYCKSCGAKIIRKRLTFKNLFEHLSETFFNYDNKLLRTFTQLIKQPEEVISAYINGVRKKYINPISFFGLSLTLSGLSLFIIKKFYIEYLDVSDMFKDVAASQKVFDQTSSSILEYNSLFYAVLIPLFALMSLLIFYNKKYNLTEHIIIYLYSMSFVNIVLVFVAQIMLFVIPDKYMDFAFLTWPLMFIYHCYILKRIFKLSFGNLILRSLVFFMLFFMVYIAICILVFIILMATGVVNLEDFRPK